MRTGARCPSRSSRNWHGGRRSLCGWSSLLGGWWSSVARTGTGVRSSPGCNGSLHKPTWACGSTRFEACVWRPTERVGSALTARSLRTSTSRDTASGPILVACSWLLRSPMRRRGHGPAQPHREARRPRRRRHPRLPPHRSRRLLGHRLHQPGRRSLPSTGEGALRGRRHHPRACRPHPGDRGTQGVRGPTVSGPRACSSRPALRPRRDATADPRAERDEPDGQCDPVVGRQVEDPWSRAPSACARSGCAGS